MEAFESVADELAAARERVKELEAEHLASTRPEYPKMLYHRTNLQGKAVHSVEEELALDPGWEDSPAKFGVETCPGAK